MTDILNKKYVKFNGKILIIGCGSVSQCAIPLVLRHIDVDPKSVTIMDFVDNSHRVKSSIEKGVKYVSHKITQENYKQLLISFVGQGDLIIDLAWNIECMAMLDFCRENNILYVYTSVEEWDPYKDGRRNDPTKYTLYARHMDLRKKIKSWGENNGATAIVDHGANPGLVSHFTKRGLLEIAQKIIDEKPKDKRVDHLKTYIKDKNFAKLGQVTGTKVIHISERDTQITDMPKRVNEFVNTWSIEGFFEEGIAPAELGWGTHERYVPRDVAINSLHELEMRQFHLQKNQRIMNDEIIDGEDQLGVLLMGHDFNSWWTGSILDIHTARRLVKGQQATTLQVAISVVAASIWMIKNPKRGFLMPDDIDHELILEISMPYISPFYSEAVDWTPLKNLNTKFTTFDFQVPEEEDTWQFLTFLVNPTHKIGAKRIDQK